MTQVLVASVALSLPLVAVAEACSSEFQIPDSPPDNILDYSGIEMQEVCFVDGDKPRHAFIIGDWGGVKYWEEHPVQPADKRSALFPAFARKFIHGIDDQAQQLVAKAMDQTATMVRPDYVLNVGDNFYWGGVDGTCGGPPFQEDGAWSSQWENIFETMYRGNMMEIPWLGVMGNHDYGGYMFSAKWAQTVGYTWARKGRWLQPALYWGQNVRYNGFTVAYYFVDTNAVEAWDPDENVDHNLCSSKHNSVGTCGDQGPKSIEECRNWFWDVWWTQWEWLNIRLEATANFQHKIVVTHYPPKWFSSTWNCLIDKYGINMFVTGHVHHQRIYGPYNDGNFISGACTVVSGGGGGITSEGIPSKNGEDDEYGFVDMQFEASKITLTAISHQQKVRKILECPTRGRPNPGRQCNDVHERRLKSYNRSSDFWDGTDFI